MNRLSSAHEASLCIHLLSEFVQSNLYELLVPLANIARQSRFRVINWTVAIPEGPSGIPLRYELERCGFIPIGPFEYCAQVETFFESSSVGQNPSIGSMKADQDSPFEHICCDCGEPFSLKAGEKLFFESRGR